MTFEARLLFLLAFFGAWAFLGLLAWACVAVARRGDGALLALPVCLSAASAFAVAVPLLGLRDGMGLLLSLPAALAGSLAGYAATLRLRRGLGAEPPPKDRSAQLPPRE